MEGNKKIGKKFKSKKTFWSEDNKFIKGIEYELTEIVDGDIFTLYFFLNKKDKKTMIFGDQEDDFEERFILSSEERVLSINKILYED